MTLIAALLLGLASSPHCLAMCGGIAGALALSLPPAVRSRRPALLAYLFAYSAGRLSSYMVGGALLGFMGRGLFQTLSPIRGHLILQLMAALLVAAVGFYLAGWFPRFALIERLGIPLWRRLEPLGRRLLPVATPWRAYAYGAVWGWLPCGLVYAALLTAVATGGAAEGALVMLVFGVGTLPSMLGAGILSQEMMRLARSPRFRQMAGIGLVLLAVAGFFLGDLLHPTVPNQQYMCGPNDSF